MNRITHALDYPIGIALSIWGFCAHAGNYCSPTARFRKDQMEVGVLARSVSPACAVLIAAVCATTVLSLAYGQQEVGSIYVHAAPRLLVFVDGQIAGITHEQDGGLIIGGVPAGEHEVRLVFNGEIVEEFRPTIAAGRRSDLVVAPPLHGPRWVQPSRQYVSQAIESASISGMLGGRALVHGLSRPREVDPARHFVALLEERGEFAWKYMVDEDRGGHSIVDAAVDGTEGVVLVGTTAESIASHFGGSDIVVVKLHADGTETWRRQFGSPEDDVGRAVSVDSSGNVLIAGSTTGSMFSENQGGADLVVMKLDAAGQLIWSRQIGTLADDEPVSLTTNAAGHVYVVGRTRGNLAGENRGGYEAFVLALDSSGETVWSRQFGAGDITDVAASAGGRIVVVGRTADRLAPREPEMVKERTDSDLYVYVRVFGSDGSTLWTQQVGYGGFDSPRAVAVHGDEFLMFVGQSEFPLVEGSEKSGGFLRAYSLDGGLLWGREIGTEANDGLTGVVVTQFGRIVASGFTEGSLFATNDGARDWFIYVLDEMEAVDSGGGE